MQMSISAIASSPPIVWKPTSNKDQERHTQQSGVFSGPTLIGGGAQKNYISQQIESNQYNCVILNCFPGGGGGGGPGKKIFFN